MEEEKKEKKKRTTSSRTKDGVGLADDLQPFPSELGWERPRHPAPGTSSSGVSLLPFSSSSSPSSCSSSSSSPLAAARTSTLSASSCPHHPDVGRSTSTRTSANARSLVEAAAEDLERTYPHVCPDCAKRMKTAQALASHMRMHKVGYASVRTVNRALKKRRRDLLAPVPPHYLAGGAAGEALSGFPCRILPSLVAHRSFADDVSQPRMLLQAPLLPQPERLWVEFGLKRIPPEEVKREETYGHFTYVIRIPHPSEAVEPMDWLTKSSSEVKVRIYCSDKLIHEDAFTYLADLPGPIEHANTSQASSISQSAAAHPMSEFCIPDDSSAVETREEVPVPDQMRDEPSVVALMVPEPSRPEIPKPPFPLAPNYEKLGSPVVTLRYKPGQEPGVEVGLRLNKNVSSFSVSIHGFKQPRYKTSPFPRWPDGSFHVCDFDPLDLIHKRGTSDDLYDIRELNLQVINQYKEVISQHQVVYYLRPLAS